jgi:hypothetical protein
LKKSEGIKSGAAIELTSINSTTAGKVEMVMELLGGRDVLDDCGCPTGEKTPQLITPEEAKKLLGFKDED